LSADQIIPDVDDAVSAPFWAALNSHKLLVQFCVVCEKPQHPPMVRCRHCAGSTLDWREVPPLGRIWTYAIAHAPVLPSLSDTLPYATGYISMESHPSVRMAGFLLAGPESPINSLRGEDIRIGQPVRAVFREVDSDVTLPFWYLVPSLEQTLS
jgi:uncharacterized protein